ncbi:protein sip-5 [Luteimonas sp. MJ246]|uniref:protein sip-5 n=1 Tax=Luteimonas sp. MJ174 TaxID=3129237 RepID=UPI0031B9D278
MSFEDLQAKVERAEAALEARERQTAADFRVFGGIWRSGWTPPRIVVAGLAGGFLAGWVRPGQAIAGAQPARWLQMLGSVAGLASSIQAAFAAGAAEDAAQDAGAAARGAKAAPEGGVTAAENPAAPSSQRSATPPGDTTTSIPRERARRPDPAWETPPRPAEAATELSESR